MEVLIGLILIVVGVFLYAKRVGFDYYDNKRTSKDNDDRTQQMMYAPKQVFDALGVGIEEAREDGSYVIAYQGGYFLFSFIKDSEWVDIHFLNFGKILLIHSHF